MRPRITKIAPSFVRVRGKPSSVPVSTNLDTDKAVLSKMQEVR